jgi:hypothetical protein
LHKGFFYHAHNMRHVLLLAIMRIQTHYLFLYLTLCVNTINDNQQDCRYYYFHGIQIKYVFIFDTTKINIFVEILAISSNKTTLSSNTSPFRLKKRGVLSKKKKSRIFPLYLCIVIKTKTESITH